MKIYAISAVLLAVIAYLWWDGTTKYDSGFNAANAAHLEAINTANTNAAKEKGDLIRKHIKEMKNAANKTAKTIKQLRASGDACLDVIAPAPVLERLRQEREDYSSMPGRSTVS